VHTSIYYNEKKYLAKISIEKLVASCQRLQLSLAAAQPVSTAQVDRFHYKLGARNHQKLPLHHTTSHPKLVSPLEFPVQNEYR
jgi:hypothetical protein